MRVLLFAGEGTFVPELESFLTTRGHAVTGIARTAADALALAVRTRPDLVLVLVRSAGADTFAFLQSLGERGVQGLLLNAGFRDAAAGSLSPAWESTDLASALERVEARLRATRKEEEE